MVRYYHIYIYVYTYVYVYIYIYTVYIQTIAQNSKSFGVEQRDSGKHQAITVAIRPNSK